MSSDWYWSPSLGGYQSRRRPSPVYRTAKLATGSRGSRIRRTRAVMKKLRRRRIVRASRQANR